MMNTKKDLLAPCGLYCGVCRIYAATQNNDLAYLRRLARIYARRFPTLDAATAEDLLCDGCLSARRSVTCRECSIRECTQQRELQGCHQCSDFPCTFIDAFPMEVGKQVILRAVPYRRTHTTEGWVLAEKERYVCPLCGEKLFRGAKECPHCRSPVDAD